MIGLCAYLILVCTNRNLTTSYEGFAVDREENIYIGRYTHIYVISPEGEVLRMIDARTNRGYKFTIKKNTIFILASTSLYKLDLFGEELEEPVDYYSLETGQKPSFSYRRFISDDGTKYIMRSPLFRTTIYRLSDSGAEPVFQMPPVEYAARLILIISSTCWVIGGAIQLVRVVQNKKKTLN